ncbi:MAG: hypothetical protein AB1480_17760 [Nitrospirota bacterium]
MKNRRKIVMMIGLIILIGIFVLLTLNYATANEIEDNPATSIHDTPVQQPLKQNQHIDPFTIAIIGLSLGCMMIASSVHWNMTKRRYLEAQIRDLDSFLASNCAVECHINGCNDNDPMMSSVKDIQNSRDAKLKEYEEHKNVMIRSISDIEAEIMRIWG